MAPDVLRLINIYLVMHRRRIWKTWMKLNLILPIVCILLDTFVYFALHVEIAFIIYITTTITLFIAKHFEQKHFTRLCVLDFLRSKCLHIQQDTETTSADIYQFIELCIISADAF